MQSPICAVPRAVLLATPRPVAHALARAFGSLTLAALFAAPALAQTAEPAQRIEVTGSSIKRIAAETALPVQVITSEDIARSGVSNAEQLLKSITATSTLGGSTVANTGAGGGQGGNNSVSTISLRGLGAQRTLVLINGRRSAPAGGGSAVDIATIPVSAIERVEVLKDGASAVYGSDAVAGVVNFILRRSASGTELSATLGTPTRSGGGREAKLTLFTGMGDFDADRYALTLSASVATAKPIFGSDRSFARNINVEQQLDKTNPTATFPANVLLPSAQVVNPNYPNCGPYSLVSPLTTIRQCRYDNAPYIALQPESTLANLSLGARFNISADLEAYADAAYTRNETLNTTQHVLINGAALPAGHPYRATLTNLLDTQYPQFPALRSRIGFAWALLPPTSPYYPTAFANANGVPAGQPLLLQLRSIASGVRKTEDVTDNIRLVTGVRGTALGWDYDAGLLYNQNKIKTSLVQGWSDTDKVLRIYNSGLVNPFGDTTDAAALASVADANYNGLWNTITTKITGVDAKASREIYKLDAGSVGLAVGAEFRKEELDIDPVQANRDFRVSGFGAPGVPTAAQRNVSSAYTELNVPILKTLEANVALRYDNYENVGSTTNPKASIRWQPNSVILVRASTGKGFRAPTLIDLYQPEARGITTNGSRDLLRCPPGTTGLADCSTQFVTVGGGNPALKPEKSTSTTLGFVVEPTRDYSIGLDAFQIEITEVIRTGLSAATILGDPARYASLITRGAPDGNPSGLGPILGISLALTNLGKTKVSGVDVDLKARVLNTPELKTTLRLNGTYISKYDQENLDGSYTSSINNPAASGVGIGVVLRWRHTASATFESGPWVGTLSQSYQVGYRDLLTAIQQGLTPRPAARTVSSYTTYDAQVSYSGFKNIRLSVGVKNLLDKDPPYTNYGAGFVGSYDLSYTDVRGRYAYVTAGYKF